MCIPYVKILSLCQPTKDTCFWLDLFGQTLGPFQIHGKYCSLVRPLVIFARSCLVDLSRLRIILSAEDNETYLEHPIPAAPVATPGHHVPPETLAAHTHTAWEEQELLQTAREFHSCKQEEGQPVSSYVLKMKSYIDNLERLGHPVTLNFGVQKNQGKKPFKAAKGNQGNGKYKLAYAPEHKPSYAPKPKKTPPPKKDNPAKDATCHQCCEIGHWRRNCPVYLAELMKKKKLSPGASTSAVRIPLGTVINTMDKNQFARIAEEDEDQETTTHIFIWVKGFSPGKITATYFGNAFEAFQVHGAVREVQLFAKLFACCISSGCRSSRSCSYDQTEEGSGARIRG
ncbi:zinc finger, CCHC-type [Artemisia annua]|uniref:Zinc finger, CCHC-type n=1 Tax=Artemisia annua TaxID=35608 RepID=A0A2U1NZB9_ARTAN|nr:zinc finger, CCHC-type [Artemisia annua]